MFSKLTFISFLFLLVSCGNDENSKKQTNESDQKIELKADWKTPLVSGGEFGTNEVTLTFLNQDGSAYGDVDVVGFSPRMPSMGNHGTDEEDQKFSKQSEAHITKVSGIYFSMSGIWVVTIKISIEGEVQTLKIEAPEVK